MRAKIVIAVEYQARRRTPLRCVCDCCAASTSPSPGALPPSTRGWLKQLDRVAGRIVERGLFASRTGDHVAAEAHAHPAQIAAFHVGERWPKIGQNSEPEMRRVELHGDRDVVNPAPHVNCVGVLNHLVWPPGRVRSSKM